MKINVWNSIQQLGKERGVAPSIIINAIKESLKVASSKYFSHNEDIHIEFQPEKGELRVYVVKKVVKSPKDPGKEITLAETKQIDAGAKIGDSIEIDLPSDTLGRIAAQAAKQVIFQKVRYAEQEQIYNTFAPRLGELVTGVIQRFESNNNIILEIQKTEVLLPQREQLPNDEFIRGDRVRAVISQVTRDERNHQVILSRTSSQFLKKLLEIEIPEIANRNIEIKDIIRQPGERAKVAVWTKEKDIDPVGACIGVKGIRILAISRELQGEKIDIVVYSDNPIEYAKNALSPAKPGKVVILSDEERIIGAIVSNEQLSLAIGKKGINVRLASRLVGWKIDLNSRT
ncbi:MAG: transcription termination factor NusA [Candidatus Aminicenantes bacterium]|nr:transcription termination factor NusA [Candidatus Aminicenantes bacterium]